MSETDALVEDRGRAYGHPRPNHERIAALWSVILGQDVNAMQVLLCLDALKTARLIHAPGHHDSVVDKAGYAELYGRITARIPEDAQLGAQYGDSPTLAALREAKE